MPIQNRRQSKGRHPLLKFGSVAHEMFLEIKRRPGITSRELTETLKKNHETCRRLIRKLKHEGLVRETGEFKNGLSGLTVENETGFARDKLAVELTFYVNSFGEYSVRTELKDQLPTATEDNPKPVHKIAYLVAVPRPYESYRTRQIFEASYSSKTTQTKKGLVIEGEILDIKVK